MKAKIAIAFLPALLLGGCQSQQPSAKTAISTPEPQRPKTHKELCMEGLNLLGDPWLDDWRKVALYEMLRNKGCMG